MIAFMGMAERYLGQPDGPDESKFFNSNASQSSLHDNSNPSLPPKPEISDAARRAIARSRSRSRSRIRSDGRTDRPEAENSQQQQQQQPQKEQQTEASAGQSSSATESETVTPGPDAAVSSEKPASSADDRKDEGEKEKASGLAETEEAKEPSKSVPLVSASPAEIPLSDHHSTEDSDSKPRSEDTSDNNGKTDSKEIESRQEPSAGTPENQGPANTSPTSAETISSAGAEESKDDDLDSQLPPDSPKLTLTASSQAQVSMEEVENLREKYDWETFRSVDALSTLRSSCVPDRRNAFSS